MKYAVIRHSFKSNTEKKNVEIQLQMLLNCKTTVVILLKVYLDKIIQYVLITLFSVIKKKWIIIF